jgi:hypothetical protein
MAADRFQAFLDSADTLRIYADERLIFSSKKDRLLPLMQYIGRREKGRGPVAIYDKIMGNAAALLCIKVKANEVFSPLGSELALKTLEGNGIKHHLLKTVPFIMRDDGQGMCPMEQLSIGKGPEEFYRLMKAKIQEKAV